MEFAPIVPLKYLTPLASLSHFHMVLAHWLVEKHYLTFYRKMWERGDFLILDNGACELGTSIPIDDLLTAFKDLGGTDILVIPDGEKNNVDLFESFWPHESKFRAVYPQFQLMAVPHSLEDLDYFASHVKVDCLGLNREMERDHTRVQLIQKYGGYNKKFHLLGCKKDPVKEVKAVQGFDVLVIGMDSSLPYRIARTGRCVSENRPFPAVIDMYERDLTNARLKHCVREMQGFIDLVGNH